MQEMQKTQVQSLDWENPLEKEMATHSSILDRKIPQTEELCRLQSIRLQRVGHNWAIEHTGTYYIYQTEEDSFEHLITLAQEVFTLFLKDLILFLQEKNTSLK